MRGAFSGFLLVTLGLSMALTASIDPPESCLDRTELETAACVSAWLEERSFGRNELRLLDSLVGNAPDRGWPLVRHVIAGLDLDSSPALRAALLDLEAEAAWRLSRPADSASAALAALDLDDGISRLSWFSAEDGSANWSAELDAGAGRHLRAARALVASGREAEARPLLERALALGQAETAAELWKAVGGGAVAGLDTEPELLEAGPWYPPLPDLEVSLAEGGTFSLASARGRVLIIDFWASWCKPCMTELPRLQQLYDAEQDHGLSVLAINLGEPVDVALRFAGSLGLDMPVGLYDEAVHEAFEPEALPVVVVADAQGRVRRRWDGYKEGVEEEIARTARSLIAADAADRVEPVAEVLRGSGQLRVAWLRRVPGSIEGMVAAQLGQERPSLVTLAGRELRVYDSAGRSLDDLKSDGATGAGHLIAGDLDGDGLDELFGFRPGGSRLIRLRLAGGDHETSDSSVPLLDVVLLPPRGEEDRGEILLATLDGLRRRRLDGAALPPIGDFGAVRSLALVARDGAGELAALVPRTASSSVESSLCRIEPSPGPDPAPAPCHPVVGARALLGEPALEGVGVLAGRAVTALGRFLRDGKQQAAVATAGGQLVLIDVDTGRERFRAPWAGITALAAADLDGDGLDELAVAQGARLCLLDAAPARRSEADPTRQSIQ